MNVNQVLNVIHPFTHVIIESVNGKLIELKQNLYTPDHHKYLNNHN